MQFTFILTFPLNIYSNISFTPKNEKKTPVYGKRHQQQRTRQLFFKGDVNRYMN